MQDAQSNYEMAEKGLDLDVPLIGDPDRTFYDRWADTLDYRWNSDFADLRLRRAGKGWKWRLVRIRPNGEVWVEPFIKPSQKPFAERGNNSAQANIPHVTSAELLSKLAAKAQWRWRGMPVTKVSGRVDIRLEEELRICALLKGEEKEDEKRLKHLIWVEAVCLRNVDRSLSAY